MASDQALIRDSRIANAKSQPQYESFDFTGPGARFTLIGDRETRGALGVP